MKCKQSKHVGRDDKFPFCDSSKLYSIFLAVVVYLFSGLIPVRSSLSSLNDSPSHAFHSGSFTSVYVNKNWKLCVRAVMAGSPGERSTYISVVVN